MVKEFLQNLAFVTLFAVLGFPIFGLGFAIVVLFWERFGWPVPTFFAICALIAAALTWLEHDK